MHCRARAFARSIKTLRCCSRYAKHAEARFQFCRLAIDCVLTRHNPRLTKINHECRCTPCDSHPTIPHVSHTSTTSLTKIVGTDVSVTHPIELFRHTRTVPLAGAPVAQSRSRESWGRAQGHTQCTGRVCHDCCPTVRRSHTKNSRPPHPN